MPRGRFITACLMVVALLALGSEAWAHWSSTGDGTGSATTATLNPPTSVVANFTPGLDAVGLAWTASAGVSPQGYFVTRIRQGDGATELVCHSSATTLITSPCADSPVPAGTYHYAVTAVHRSWTSTSGDSNIVVVVPDASPPVVTVATVNGASPAFPYRTNSSVTSIGGACGSAPGDSATVTPLIDGTATATAACVAGYWTFTLGTPLSSDATVILSARQSDATGNTGAAPERMVTIDRTRPTVSSIVRSGASQWVNAGPLSWVVTFSEAVSGVAVSNFGVVASGVTGTPTISGVTPLGGSPSATWAVSVGTVGVTGTNAGLIGMNLGGSGSITDSAGNALSPAAVTGEVYAYDTTPPAVTGVSSMLANGSYRAGQVIPVTVTFSEPVIVTGTPQLTLSTGTAATTSVDYTAGSGSTGLSFEYTVAAGDASADLEYAAATSLARHGGTITDAATNTATLTLPNPGAPGSLGATKDLVVDTTPPEVTGVSSMLANGSYRAGQVIPVTVTFSEPAIVTGTPQLTLSTGTAATTSVDYTAGSGSTRLTFEYTVAAGDASADLDYAAATSLAHHGGTITDAATNTATLTLPNPGAPGSLGATNDLVIDTIAPAVIVTSVNGSPRAFPYSTSSSVTSIGGSCGTATGDSATVAPRINGAATSPANATCVSGSWTLTLGTALSTDGARTVSATQVDAAGNTGAAPERMVTIDRTRPTVSSIVRSGASQWVNAGPLSWVVTFSEAVSGVAVSNFGVVASGVTGTPTISGVTPLGGSPSATWAVSVGTVGVTGTNAGLIGVNLTARGSVVDAVGNTLSTTAFTGPTYSYDTTKATVVGVSSTLANGAYKAGRVIPVTVTFSETVVVTGIPLLTLATGTPATTAVDYSSGSGSTTLTFEYTVADGNTAADLDYASATSLALNGGAITDSASNAATLNLPAPGATGSLGNAKALVIDTTPPAVTVTGMTKFPLFFRWVRASGSAEVGAGPVTVYLCFNVGPPCDASNATETFTNVSVAANGSWQTTWSSQASQGTWYARATQADPAGNVGTSGVYGPYTS